ncbi:hypothetical protein MMC28_004820, partial [Mycoblastus sanguinarius]|nr:hypothetical protein [Mycoblastus sanguinarius]
MGLTKKFVDFCGLGLRIGPRFFEALLDIMEWSQSSDYGHEHESMPSFSLTPDHIIIRSTIATIAEGYLPENAEAPPVVLIAVDHSRYTRYKVWGDGKTSPFVPGGKTEPPKGEPRIKLFFQAYARILSQLLEPKDSAAARDINLPLLSMKPLLSIDALHVRENYKVLRQAYIKAGNKPPHTKEFYSLLSLQRYSLRRQIEDSMASRGQFQ